MKKKVILILLFLLVFMIITIIFSILFIHEYILFFSPRASALDIPGEEIPPPSIQNFYGEILWPNGSVVDDVHLVEARINGEIVENATSINGSYGYAPLFTIEDVLEGTIVNFYVDSFFIAETKHVSFEFTNLDLMLPDVCGDNYCTGEENCVNCREDCGACPDDGGGSSGGGGGSGISGTEDNENQTQVVGTGKAIKINDEEQKEDEEETKSEEKPKTEIGEQSPITGFTIGDNLLRREVYIPLILILMVALILAIVSIIRFKHKHLEIRPYN